MQVTESAARDMFAAMGHGDVGRWNTKKLTARLNNIEGFQDGAAKLADGSPERDLFAAVSAARQEGNAVTLEGAPAGTNGTAAGNGAAKNGQRYRKHQPSGKGVVSIQKTTDKPKKDKKVTGTVRKERTDLDALGSRLGSACAKVNAVLTKAGKPLTESAIRKAAGVKSSVEYHLDKLVRLGKLKWRKGTGYSLAAR